MRQIIHQYTHNRATTLQQYGDWEVKQYQRDTKTLLGMGPNCLVCINTKTNDKIRLEWISGILEMYVSTAEKNDLLSAIPDGGNHLTVAESLPKADQVKHMGFLLRELPGRKYDLYRLNPNSYNPVDNIYYSPNIISDLMVMGMQLAKNIGAVLDQFLSRTFQENISLQGFGVNTQRMSVLTLEQENNNRMVMWEAKTLESQYDEITLSIQSMFTLLKLPRELMIALCEFVWNIKSDFRETLKTLSDSTRDDRIAGLWRILDTDYPNEWTKSDYIHWMSYFEKNNPAVGSDMRLVFEEWQNKRRNLQYYTPHSTIGEALLKTQVQVLHTNPYFNMNNQTTYTPPENQNNNNNNNNNHLTIKKQKIQYWGVSNVTSSSAGSSKLQVTEDPSGFVLKHCQYARVRTVEWISNTQRFFFTYSGWGERGDLVLICDLADVKSEIVDHLRLFEQVAKKYGFYMIVSPKGYQEDEQCYETLSMRVSSRCRDQDFILFRQFKEDLAKLIAFPPAFDAKFDEFIPKPQNSKSVKNALLTSP